MIGKFSLNQQAMTNNGLFKAIGLVSKWSMADVFVVGILLVFLATRDQFMGAEKELTFFAMKLNVKFNTTMTSELKDGFYFFLGYCFFSLIFSQFSYSIMEL